MHIPAVVLGDHVQGLPERGVRLARHRVAMHRRNDIWAGLVHGRMNRKARGIDCVHVATDYRAFVINQNEIVRSYIGKASCVRVDPETVWKLWVSHRHMAAGTFVVVTLRAEPA